MINEKNITKTTVALCIPIVMACIDVMALSVGLNSIVKQFLTPVYQTQWLFSAYMIANSAFLIVIGRLADIYGRRRFLLLGISGFTIASLIAACSFNFWALVASRAIQGLAGAAIVTTSIALITHNFELPERSKILAKWVFSVGFGLAFGPLVGGVIIYLANWRFIFLINLPIGLISYWLVKNYINESKSDMKPESSHILNAFFLCMTILFISTFLSESDSWGWFSTYSIILIVAFLISLLLFIYLENKKRYLIHWDFCKKETFVIGLIAGFFSYFFMYAWLFIYSLYLQEVRGLSSLYASIVCIAYSVAFAFGPLYISKYCANLDDCKYIKISFIFASIAFILMTITPMKISLVVLMISFFILGFSIATINVSSMALATRDVSKNESGFISGIIFTSRWLGGAIGVVLITIIFHAASIYRLKIGLRGVNNSYIINNMSNIISSGHIADIKIKFSSHAASFTLLAKKSLTAGLTFSFIILTILSITCLFLINTLSGSLNIKN